MSEDLLCNITRANAAKPIARNIVVQADKVSAAEAATFQGADPHFTYKMLTTMLPLSDPQLVLFRDHVVDQQVVDAITGTNRTFLIISDPAIHTLDGHWEWVAVRMRGK